MAVELGTNEALYIEQAVVTAFPFTFACWFVSYTLANNQPCIWVGDKASDTYGCHIWGRAAGDNVAATIEKHAATFARQSLTAVYTVDTWQHAAGVFDGPNSLRAYLNGIVGTHSTSTSGVPAGYDRTALGCRMGLTPYYGARKDLAEAAIWLRALSAWEIAALAAGWSPLFFLDSLAAYWPLGGLHGNHYRDIIGGLELTAVGAPAWIDHPPVIYRTGPQILRPLWEPLTYSVVRSDYVTTVTVTSDRPATVYFHWYVDGVFIASTRSPTRSFRLSQGEQLRIEVRATSDPDYDPLSDPPLGWPARRSLWWVRSTDSSVSYYRVDQKLGAGDWETLRIVPQVADQWAYSLLSDRLDDLSTYTWRVIPVDAAGNDGSAVTIGAELIVRTPDGPDFTATFDSGTTKVTFDEA